MRETETIDFEREFAELVHELRAVPAAAPQRLRERTRALGEPAPGHSLPVLPWRRALLVLTPACALLLVVAAVVHGVLNSAPKAQVAGSGGASVHPSLHPQRIQASASCRRHRDASRTTRPG